MFKILIKKLKELLGDITPHDVSLEVTYEQPKPLQDVKIYSEEGKLIESYNSVYLSHWDKNIYNIYTKEGGDFIIRVDKGANMMLTSQDTLNQKVKSE